MWFSLDSTEQFALCPGLSLLLCCSWLYVIFTFGKENTHCHATKEFVQFCGTKENPRYCLAFKRTWLVLCRVLGEE